MEREKLSVRETLWELIKDFGSLAVAVMTLGRIKLGKNQDKPFGHPQTSRPVSTTDEMKEKGLHPSAIRRRPEDF
jgi:hypothetical protein